jgi:hypothetical protein
MKPGNLIQKLGPLIFEKSIYQKATGFCHPELRIKGKETGHLQKPKSKDFFSKEGMGFLEFGF